MRASFLCPKCDNFACLHTCQDQNELHLKRFFFFAKIDIFCKSIAGPLLSVVQAYTQTYSFGGRIKLIICQIRHELSVTIHEISTRWKKTLDGGPYICILYSGIMKHDALFKHKATNILEGSLFPTKLFYISYHPLVKTATLIISLSHHPYCGH